MAGIYPTGAQDLDYRIAHIYYIESIDPSSALPNGTHLGTGAIAYAETRVCDGASGQRQVGAAVTAGAALNDAHKGAVTGAEAGRGPLFDGYDSLERQRGAEPMFNLIPFTAPLIRNYIPS